MDARRTTSPTHTFVPGPLPILSATNDANTTSTRYHLRHATLPGEGVCTENLTPFTKLLPCAARSGLGGLLAPHKLFDADWHGMGVHVTWDPEIGVKVRLSFRAVFDPTRNGAGKRGQFVVLVVPLST
jgi:phosphatidylinositol glycan class T